MRKLAIAIVLCMWQMVAMAQLDTSFLRKLAEPVPYCVELADNNIQAISRYYDAEVQLIA